MRTLTSLMSPFTKTAAQGAATVAVAAIAPNYFSGKYFTNCAIAQPDEIAMSKEYQAILANFTEKIIQKFANKQE